MAVHKKISGDASPEVYEQIESVRKRIRQKRRLYYHFMIFLVGSVFLIIINKFLNVKADWDWFVWAIVLWAFILVIHTFNVFITHKFMGKAWEEKQREKLIARQKARIAEMQKEIDKAHPLPGQRREPPVL